MAIHFGDAALRVPGPGGGGEIVERDGETSYRIGGYHTMPPFFMSVVSGFDHWLFVSSTGGLTCGRRQPENALFPYCTDDKIHDARFTTGPKTALLVERSGKTSLWLPFDAGPFVYRVDRNLYKNVPGNKLTFEEINHELGLAFAYTWSTGNRFGFIRTSRLTNLGAEDGRVTLIDGVRNLVPYGVERAAQSELSTLVDGYKHSEAAPDACAGIYTLSSILTDRAEPSEALKATIAWSTGLDRAGVLLSEDQLDAFCSGEQIRAERLVKGKRGAFFVHAELVLPARAGRRWDVLADVEQGPSDVAALLRAIGRGVTSEAIDEDIAAGTSRLERLAGAADAFQKSSDALVSGRHFSNTLCNVMRGGVFPHGYGFPTADFLEFVGERDARLRESAASALAGLEGPLTLESAVRLAERSGDPDLARLVYEYLPLTFSRRHGDPSRPWNHFSIVLENPDGSERLDYQGNWRDIFQNWEALALSFPGYLESFIARFVNASTPDGHNPYRVFREGFDWETIDPDQPWSNIGYWGDHQVIYLLRLLELSRAYHPGRLGELLSEEIFVFADVPYRIRPYEEQLQDPRDTVAYDDEHARMVAARVEKIGADGKLVTLRGGPIYRVNLLEKLLLSGLARLGSLVPGGGIWMNTQRPEWNDANNALVGFGLSMVTLCHLRRYLRLLADLLRGGEAASYDVSAELARFYEGATAVLRNHEALLGGPVDPAGRKSFMDTMGAVSECYRSSIYGGFRGRKIAIAVPALLDGLELALRFVDHSIAHGRRDDGLFHSYNLAHFSESGYSVEPLDEMLEGQVAALGSGLLDAESSLALLDALRQSRLYRADQQSYVLYPDRPLPSFLEKNVIPAEVAERCGWIGREIASGRTAYVECDVNGRVHFNGEFRNAKELRAALDADPEVGAEDADALCEAFEEVFSHRRFTGRSGAMYKYEGLGCIYWHMVSKLALATGEAISRAVDDGAAPDVVERLGARFREIQAGLGLHKTPAGYGAFPVDPYSHTPGFAGVQQPGLTGQVKEDVITRFWQLGVKVAGGRVSFEPVVLDRGEFLGRPASWSYTVGGPTRTDELPAGSLAFTLCGVPVVYRLAETARIEVTPADGEPTVVSGSCLGPELSGSLFRRDGQIRKLVVDVPDAGLLPA